MFHLVPYKWFRRTENITELGLDYKEVGIYDIVENCKKGVNIYNRYEFITLDGF